MTGYFAKQLYAVVALNGVETDPGDSGFVEGTWALTGLSTSLTDPTGTVGGSGIAQPTGGITRGAVQAMSDITLERSEQRRRF